MRAMRVLLTGLIVLCLFGSVSASSADTVEMAKKWYDDRQAFNSHATNVANAIREVGKDRTTILNFTSSALNMINSYKAARAGGSIDLGKILQLAPDIMSLANGYQALAPKVQSVYNRITPDIEYFKKFQGEKSPGDGSTAQLPTFDDGRINNMARAAGWSRVWGSIKDNPLNVFRWGRLADEYKYGRDTTAYGLKGVQVAMEAYNVYASSLSAFKEILSIKDDIQRITQGNFGAILGVGGTIQKINGAEGSIKQLEGVLKTAPQHFDKRLNELSSYQQKYLETFRSYAQKYGDPEGRKVAAKAPATPPIVANSAQSSQSRVTRTTAPVANTGTPTTTGGQSLPTWRTPPIAGGGTTVSLPDAMKTYQALYAEYMKLMSNSSATERQRQEAAQKLQSAYKTVQQLKSNIIK